MVPRKVKIAVMVLSTEMGLSWEKLVRHISECSPGVRIKVPKDRLDSPLKHGFRKSIGLRFYHKHYRLRLPDNRCVHVEETRRHYIIHVDSKDPGVSPFGHLRTDAPGLWAALWTGVGLTAGLIAGAADDKNKGLTSALGAIIGLIVGFLTGRWGRK